MAIQYNTLEEFHKLVDQYKGDGSNAVDLMKIGDETVLDIQWQNGGTAENAKNGVFIEDVLAVTYARLASFQDKFPCRENALALTKIEEAVLWLAQRKAEREHRDVYGKEEK